MKTVPRCDKGFTLIEMMVAIAIFSIALTTIYALFSNQVKASNTNREVVAMQQNVRAALSFMERDIRMAGFDPTGSSAAGIVIANGARLQFQIDQNQNGTIDAGETITYALDNCDADGDGIADGTPCNLGRDNDADGNGTADSFQPLARNIDALNFDYFDADGNNITNKGVTPWVVPAAQIAAIQSIQVSIVGRSGAAIPAFFFRQRDNRNYANRSNDVILPAQADNFRRMQATTEVDCRNLGI
jgi:type IV pilus assembly protein PilW